MKTVTNFNSQNCILVMFLREIPNMHKLRYVCVCIHHFLEIKVNQHTNTIATML